MSNKSIVWTIVALAAGVVAASGLSSSAPIARGGQEIAPGGRAGKIRSYFAQTAGPTVTVIPSVEGVNGFVVTDIMATAIDVGRFRITLIEDGGATPESKAQFMVQGDDGGSFPVSYHFESGLLLTPGRSLQASTNLSFKAWSITISGYTF